MREAPKYLQGGAAVNLPRSLLWVIAILCLAAGVLGYSRGRDVAALTETDVLQAYAEVYASETGGRHVECLGVPGEGKVWIVVRCGSGADQRIYSVGRDGGLVNPLGKGPDA
ncbi:hypothetical protein [Oceaniglobus roseus]|uniref:hypothetical protein n=1 Tax=Oceaniglobus roseus TaxID=1737570 RepID=UPI000C7EC3C1|nr:hypothetical protein [Kandeliimicrobium roseum]